MVKKHIRHFSRGLIIGLEVFGVTAFAIFVAWLFLIIRLSQGPMNVDFLTSNIEKELNSRQTGFEFDVGSTVLTWGGTNQPFVFEMSQVRINRADKTPVLSVEKIGVQLSKRYLVFGRFVPRAIKIHGPALKVLRAEDGHFMLNMSDAEAATAPKPEAAGNQSDFLKELLVQLEDRKSLGILGGLQQISIADAVLAYEDRILNVTWKSRKSNVTFTRSRGGLLVDSISNLELDQTHQAYVRGSFYYSWQTNKPNGVIYFTGFNPSLMAQQSEQLKSVAGIDLSLDGSVSFYLDHDFKLGSGRFALSSNAGKFNVMDLYPEPLSVKSFYMQGKFDASTWEAVLDELRADLDGPRIKAQAEISKQADGRAIRVKAVLENMPMDHLKTYWPEKLTPDPRAWVTGHLSAGTATTATLNLVMLAPPEDFSELKLQKVGGQIDFSGIKVDYFPPLMPVTKVNGRATYDHKSFSLDINAGMLGDMKVTKSKINIIDLDVQNAEVHSKIDINVTLAGPLRTALKVLDSKPLQYPQELGIQTGEVEGGAAVDVNFKFPLHKALALPEVKVAAKARLNEVLLKNIVSDFSLTGGPMDLEVSTGALTVKGSGRLGGMAVEFDWLKNFSANAAIASKVEAKLPLDALALEKFGIPSDFKILGTLPARVIYTVPKNHMATLVFKGDITPTGFTVPGVNYEKLVDIPGTLDLSLAFNKEGKPSRISGLNLATAGAVLRGNIDFSPDGKSAKKMVFSQVLLGDTDIALEVDNKGKEGYVMNVTGKQFDASKLFARDDKPNSDEEAAKPVMPLTVSMTVNRLVTGKNKYIEQIRMFMRRNGWNRIEQLQVNGISGGKPIALNYTPVPRGHTLHFEAGNAGVALRALGITDGVRGGKIVVTGKPNPNGGLRDLQGSMALTDFTLVNVPVLGMLLNAMSLTGIVELLNGKGIAFKKMRSDFWWIDKGQPESAKNVRSIRLKNGETSGASLGLTFEGEINNWANTLDISGTIIPVSDLNKLVGAIPLFGDILTGGGKGIFAATYSIQGPKDKPNVLVNPLAVLAPGIFRKLFFEN